MQLAFKVNCGLWQNFMILLNKNYILFSTKGPIRFYYIILAEYATNLGFVYELVSNNIGDYLCFCSNWCL